MVASRACIKNSRMKPTKISVWAVHRRMLLSKTRFWKSRSTIKDFGTWSNLELNKEPKKPWAAALILLLTLRLDAGCEVEGCIPWENQTDNRISIPIRQTLTAKISSILKSMANIYTLSLFPVIGMSCWFIIFWLSIYFADCVNEIIKNDACCPSLFFYLQ